MILRCIGCIMLCFSLSGCINPIKEEKGSLITDKISSQYLNKEVNFVIYQPPGFQKVSGNLPVIYLLHGHGGNEMDWFENDEGNIAPLLDSLIKNEKIPPCIAVSVDAGNSWYVDHVERMNSFYLGEFIPFIDSTYGDGISNPERHIAGNSAGGYGALRFAFQRPELFKSAILLSPAAYEPLPPQISSSRQVEAFNKEGEFNDSIWQSYSYKNLIPSLTASAEKPVFYLSVGDDDVYNIVPVVTSLQQFLILEHISNELRITDGGHDWACWRKNFTYALVDLFAK